MPEVKDTKETKEVLDLVLTVAQVVQQAAADKKVDLADIGLLLQLVPVAGPALEGVKEIPAELADLSDAEGVDLVAHVAAKLAINDEHAKAIILASLKASVALWGVVQAIKTPVVASAAV